MKDNHTISIIGGYDLISKSFFSKIRSVNKNAIFINVNNTEIKNQKVYNFQIYELKKILNTLKKHKIKNILFLGKIKRPNLSKFKRDGVIDKYIPTLVNSYKVGDGKVLSCVLDIFIEKGFNIINPYEISDSFFFNDNEINVKFAHHDKIDADKSINILNDLSKYDNAQSIVSVNGYILAIEAAEGTDQVLSRVIALRKKLNQIKVKAGLLIKIPKESQSKLVDLPVVGLNTLKLIKKANLNGLVINHRLTIVHNKARLLKYAKSNELKVYSIF